eukprot:101844_1
MVCRIHLTDLIDGRLSFVDLHIACTVQSRQKALENNETAIYFDGMQINRTYETKRVVLELNGSFYSSARYIKLSSFPSDQFKHDEDVHSALSSIFGHGCFEFQFNVGVQTAIVAFPS